MLKSRTGILLALAVTVAGGAPALAQSKYATDPDVRIYSRLGAEHLALSHENAVLPRTTLAKAYRAPARADSSQYATDPDPAIYGTLAREHMNTFNHDNAVLPPTTIKGNWHASAAPFATGSAGSASQPNFNPAFDRAKGSL